MCIGIARFRVGAYTVRCLYPISLFKLLNFVLSCYGRAYRYYVGGALGLHGVVIFLALPLLSGCIPHKTHLTQDHTTTLHTFLTMPVSDDVARIVQDHISKVHRELPVSYSETFDDFEAVVDKLAVVIEGCRFVRDMLKARDATYNRAEAIKHLEHALDWDECMLLGSEMREKANQAI